MGTRTFTVDSMPTFDSHRTHPMDRAHHIGHTQGLTNWFYKCLYIGHGLYRVIYKSVFFSQT